MKYLIFLALTIAAASAGSYSAAPSSFPAAPQTAPARPSSPIVTYNAMSDDFGNYNFKYVSSDGTVREEKGHQNGDEHVKDGSVQYLTPEGKKIQLTFTADKNGYRPQGEHLPTPPPVPQAILDSIALIRATQTAQNVQTGSVAMNSESQPMTAAPTSPISQSPSPY